MANHTPPPQPTTLLLLFLFLLITAVTAADTDQPNSINTYQELEITLEALRTHGYTLFYNAITTSDLQYQLLTLTTTAVDSAAEPSPKFTVFAPKDAPLFSLDMASDASAYVGALRYHVIPNHRLTFSDLQNLSSPFLDTLLPHYSVLIGKTLDADVVFNSSGSTGLMVDGVRVSDPDLFLGPRIVVHGIDGVLETGLNVHHQDFGGSDNGAGLLSPAESPAPLSGFGWNIPAGGSPTPTSGVNRNDPEAPASQSNGNIPVIGTLPPVSVFDRSSVPMAPASQSHGDILVETFPGRANNLGKRKHGRRHRRKHRLNGL